MREIYTLNVRMFTSFFSWFFRSTGETVGRILTRFCARKCLLGLENLNLIFIFFIEKIQKKKQWHAPMVIFFNSLNCHNCGCMQDRVVMLVLDMVFGVGQFNQSGLMV